MTKKKKKKKKKKTPRQTRTVSPFDNYLTIGKSTTQISSSEAELYRIRPSESGMEHRSHPSPPAE
ncbi:hypothetical protein RRF57_011549 [Xylaria bambusicola]|uniref:Uncharacterized protein n=1 Tax=Xylaria bambusicola TaxID=326684 RepID=A0AAN7ZA06_9PEZI